MKEITITIHRDLIRSYVDNATFKMVDATMDGETERRQGAVTSDSEDSNDAYLINELCDQRDARIRTRLEFCLSRGNDATVSFDNTASGDEDYVYNLCVPDECTETKLKAVVKMLDSYIKRGSVLSWYLNAGIAPNDSEQAIETILDEAVYILRGQPWGRRPMQPFGPSGLFNYKSK